MFRFTASILLAATFANADAQDFGNNISRRDYKMAARKLYIQMKKTSEENEGQLIIDLDLLDSDVKGIFETNGFTIPSGETLTFKVSGNPTTGYEWHFQEEATEGAFDVVENYTMDPIEEYQKGYTGIGGTYTWTLTANEDAEVGDLGVFRIAESRDWEDHDVASYIFPIQID